MLYVSINYKHLHDDGPGPNIESNFIVLIYSRGITFFCIYHYVSQYVQIYNYLYILYHILILYKLYFIMFIHLNLYAVHNYISKDHMILSPQDNLLGEWITAAPASLWSNSDQSCNLRKQGRGLHYCSFSKYYKNKIEIPWNSRKPTGPHVWSFHLRKKLPLK